MYQIIVYLNLIRNELTREFLKKNVKLSGKSSLAAVYVLINQMLLIKNLSQFCCCLGNRKCHSLSNWCQILEPSTLWRNCILKKNLKCSLTKINLVSSLNGRETMQCSKFSNQDANGEVAMVAVCSLSGF